MIKNYGKHTTQIPAKLVYKGQTFALVHNEGKTATYLHATTGDTIVAYSDPDNLYTTQERVWSSTIDCLMPGAAHPVKTRGGF